MNNIFVFGPSCSGKSTLCQALETDLGSTWTRIDRDDLIEENLCTNETSNAELDKRIETIKNRVIIDAQIPWREKKENELYFSVLPLLEILLTRDAQSTISLKRTERRAHYAREYVNKTYDILNSLDKSASACIFDSSRISLEEEIKTVKTFLENKTTPIRT